MRPPRIRPSPSANLSAWLEHLIQKSAWELETARKTIFQFGASVSQALSKNPIQEWESALWARGLNHGLLRLEGYFFRAGSGKRSALSFFVRNDEDVYVGLRREAITQAAVYVTLVTDYGYGRDQTRFESRWMDVAVYDEAGKTFMYAETKSSPKVLATLCARLAGDFVNGLPQVRAARLTLHPSRSTAIDDAVMKAQHIWTHRPHYFWGVSPTARGIYEVVYTRDGFTLDTCAAVPGATFEPSAIYAD